MRKQQQRWRCKQHRFRQRENGADRANVTLLPVGIVLGRRLLLSVLAGSVGCGQAVGGARVNGWRRLRSAVVESASLELPRIVPVRASSVFRGDGWMGVKMRDASIVTGVGVLPIFAGLIGLLLLLGAFAATWLREGR